MKITSNMKVFVIVESPNKVSTLKGIFKKLGYTHVNVDASVGHITSIKDDPKSYKNTGIYPDKDFKTNYCVTPDKKKVVQKLQKEIDEAEVVILMTDEDREGEAISWHLKQVLKIPEKKYVRATTHEITEFGVKNAMENLRKIDDNLVAAAHTRAVLDKLVGYSLSPIAQDRLNCRSVGRTQSAGLKMITEREQEINNFIPEKYFELFLLFEKNGTQFKAKYIGTKDKEIKRIQTAEECKEICARCSGTNGFTISSVETKKLKESPKPPFTTSTFQQEANRRLGLSVDAVTYCAQKLFEGISIMGEHVGLITYIRTDDDTMSPEFAESLGEYVKTNYGEKYYAAVKKGATSENAQNGHECLRVTNLYMTPTELSNYITDANLLRVYKLIWQRTVQSSMAPATIGDTEYMIENNEQLFSMHSREVLFDGYRKVLVNEEDEIKTDEVVKESFKKGEKLKKTELKEEEKSTAPPKKYTEASFLKALDQNGVGRPSTFSTIIKTILDEKRGYCKIENKAMAPTQKGMELSEFLEQSFPDLINVQYTSNLEKKLDEIANGSVSSSEFLYTFFKELEESIKKVGEIDRICPKCGGKLIKKRGKYGFFYGCENWKPENAGCNYIEK